MTTSTPTLTPGAAVAPGVGADAELFRRVTRDDYPHWLNHIAPAAGCAHPIRLRGTLHHVEADTGRLLESRHTSTMPDETLYVPCSNRRAVVCPSCAETYRADTFHLIRAGLAGGKGVPDTVTDHPCLFLTLTAPSFGPVHTRHLSARTGAPRPCRRRRNPETCPHGLVLACDRVHDEHDTQLGRPLCPECYDYPGHAVWNAWAGELWRRTTITANRELRRLAKSLGVRLRLSYAKVAEYQRRGLVHFHALIRLDGHDPTDPDAILAPDERVTTAHLEDLLRHAASSTTFRTPAHPANPEGWRIAWGGQLDPRHVTLSPVDVDDAGQVTTTAVAAYLAKYATKATETTGHAAARITTDTITVYADPTTHTGRLVAACWRLGKRPRTIRTSEERDTWAETYGRLRRWAHMLGFGGHFSTKSRRYSTTLGALRAARRAWHRAQTPAPPAPAPPADHDTAGDDTVLVINELTFAGIGWHTSADALLANTAAARAREQRATAREELTTANYQH
jgi:hypothetical protein